LPAGQVNPALAFVFDVELKIRLQTFDEQVVATRFERAADARSLQLRRVQLDLHPRVSIRLRDSLSQRRIAEV